MKKLLAAVALIALTATTAAAQKGDGKAGDDVSSLPNKIKVLDFGKGDTINGDVPSGDGFVTSARVFADFGSLIRIRTDFIAEITKAADDI
ncbi:MAG: hypothetical protein H6709_15720 [Kofleriaceae bacterium]|nr:hypothetical protein [Myxococcales bacterium]MCB9561473.1 hypothetical protein [Kofleriaceae bacterium]MCB9573527.1 hypothetical protein [Kofleriaceae bacterium]